jgi:putative endonuclease
MRKKLPKTFAARAAALLTAALLAVRKRLTALLPPPRRAPEEQPAHLRTGREGERLAYRYLRRQGYVMVARNWRCRGRKGEIDLIGWHQGVLCFIEVKTRRSRSLVPAEMAVDREKQRELRGMAALYCRRRNPQPPARFDVVSVYLVAGADPEIELFKDAFPWRTMSGRRRA